MIGLSLFSKVLVCIFLVLASFAILAVKQIAFGADEFTLDSKTITQNLNEPIKLKVIASANGETKAKKTSSISEPNSGPINIPFQFKNKNDIVSVGYNDEYYFSRFFKKNTDISPQVYRETVGFGKAELN